MLELFQSVLSALEANLVQKEGAPAGRLTGGRALQAARALKILTPDEAEILNELRMLRNKIAHGAPDVVVTRLQADTLRDRVLPILWRLDARR